MNRCGTKKKKQKTKKTKDLHSHPKTATGRFLRDEEVDDVFKGSAAADGSRGLLFPQGGLRRGFRLSRFSKDTWAGTLRALQRADRVVRKKPASAVGSAADPNGSWASFPGSWRKGGTGPQSLPRPRPA